MAIPALLMRIGSHGRVLRGDMRSRSRLLLLLHDRREAGTPE